MGKLYSNMTEEEKVNHYAVTEKYRKAHPEMYRSAALKYYHANKEKARTRNRLWRSKNKEYIKVKQKEDKRKRKIEAINYLGGKCEKCGLVYPSPIFEFHHTNPLTKTKDPSKMLSLSREKLYKELDKCQLLCANCHRLVHHTWEDIDGEV